MKTFVFAPKIEGLTGEIELSYPGFDDRFEFFELFADHGEEKSKVSQAVENVKAIRKMVKWSERFYKRVELAVDGQKISSFEELSEHPELTEVLIEVANKVAELIRPSKKKQS